MWWWTVALAGNELCEPVRLKAVASAADRATEAFAAEEPLGARSALAEVREGLTCLMVPAPRDLLAQVAWLEAEQAIRDFDVSGAWPWVWLAQDVGQGPPKHLMDQRHPLQRWIGEMPPRPPRAGPAATVSHPDGSVWIDGERLTAARVRTLGPHYVQVLDKREVLDIHWQWGDAFKSELLVATLPDTEPAQKRGDIAYWERWLVDNPDSQWVAYAQQKLDALRYREAALAGGPGLEAYLASTPGEHRPHAEAALEEMELARATMTGSPRVVGAFLERHPEGRFRGDALRTLETLLWERAEEQDIASAYAAYLEAFPQGPSASKARSRMADRLLARARREGAREELLEIARRFPGTMQGARARGWADEHTIRTVTVGGVVDEALVLQLRTDGFVVERDLGRRTASGDELPANGALLFTHVELVDGLGVARGELWLPGGDAPVLRWEAHGLDAEMAVATLVQERPSLDAWR